jgi:hypothetical protein
VAYEAAATLVTTAGAELTEMAADVRAAAPPVPGVATEAAADLAPHILRPSEAAVPPPPLSGAAPGTGDRAPHILRPEGTSAETR